MAIRFFLILYCHVERSETSSMENVKKIQAKIFRLFRHVRTSETLAYTCKYDKNQESTPNQGGLRGLGRNVWNLEFNNCHVERSETSKHLDS